MPLYDMILVMKWKEIPFLYSDLLSIQRCQLTPHVPKHVFWLMCRNMETMFVIKSILSDVFTLKKLLNFTFFWLSLILVKKRGGGLSFDLVAIIVYRSRCLLTNRNINIGVFAFHT